MTISMNIGAERAKLHAKCRPHHAKYFAKSLISLTQSTLRRCMAQSGAKPCKAQRFQGLPAAQSTSRKVPPLRGKAALHERCACLPPSWSWGREIRQNVQWRLEGLAPEPDSSRRHISDEGVRNA